MTSKDLVRKAIHFASPERLPFTGSMSVTDFSGDTVALFPDMGGKWWLGGGGTDEWGCFWEVSNEKDMGQVKNIILENLEDFSNLKIPDSLNPDRYSNWAPALEQAEQEGKYIVVCNGPFLFERAHFVHGFENTLMDIAADPEQTQEFLRHLASYHLNTIKYIKENFPGRIHGYRGTDDWGTQTAPLISPTSFAQVFQPVYAEIFQAIHEAGMDAWMHSCGQNLPLLPLLIEAGLDVINLMQPNVFPIPRLAELKGKVCFEVGADAQTTLPAGDKEQIVREVEGLLEACCTDQGGLIEVQLDQIYFDGDHVPPEIGPFLHEEYRKRDPFKTV